MKAATLAPERTAAPVPALPRPMSAASSRLADYVALTKPRVAVLVLFTVAAGALLAGGGTASALVVLHAVLGTALVAGGASALNQWLESARDARMQRTRERPLPAGRLQSAEALAFGVGLAIAGIAYLLLALPSPWAAVLAGATFLLYVAVYTPLKPLTTLNTLIGAVPGAMPPLIGWCAARGTLTWEAVPLFLVLFLWQLPHFYAIAWNYRDEYARAGHRMLPVVDPTGSRTGWHMVGYCVALLAASLLPVAWGMAGAGYLAGALGLGLVFLGGAVGFLCRPGKEAALFVLRCSLVYLPGLLALLVLDRAWGP